MSKSLHGMPFVLVLFVLVLASCAPAPGTPTPTTPPETPTLNTITVEPTTAPTATLIPVPLAGPQSATAMKWMDTSLLAYVPAGEFTMGSGAGDSPEHGVSLDAYWIQQTEVANGMYSQCVLAGGCTPPTQEIGAPVYTNPEFSSHPAVGVTWDQAAAYCTWAGGRLPTEAEWEKAARGPDGRLYPWGDTPPSEGFCNFDRTVDDTTPAGAYPDSAGPYGVHDLAGNVLEWTRTRWGPNPAVPEYGYPYTPDDGRETPAHAHGPNPDSLDPADRRYLRVLRGGAFNLGASCLRCAFRTGGAPARGRPNIGFRVVWSESPAGRE